MRMTTLAAGILLALALALPSPAQELADAGKGGLDRDAVFSWALEHAATLAQAKSDLAGARDRALYAASLWQSSLGLSGNWQQSLGAGSPSGPAAAGAGGADDPLANLNAALTASIKPFNFLGIDASIDRKLDYSLGLSIKPFADASQERSASQALDDQLLKYDETQAGFRSSIAKSWSSWARSALQLAAAQAQLANQTRSLAEKQARWDAGALSTNDLDSARSDLLSAQKNLNDQTVAELGARYSLLDLAGLPLDTALASPRSPERPALRQRAASALEGALSPRSGSALGLAERALERAQADVQRLPGLLSGLSASASLSGGEAGLSSWRAGLSFNLAASAFSPQESDSRQRALESAQRALQSARTQAALARARAASTVQGALALAESAELQAARAGASYEGERTRHAAGASSDQKLADSQLAYERARASADAAWWDLETELLSWE